jgi:hypothetical protein
VSQSRRNKEDIQRDIKDSMTSQGLFLIGELLQALIHEKRCENDNAVPSDVVTNQGMIAGYYKTAKSLFIETDTWRT